MTRQVASADGLYPTQLSPAGTGLHCLSPFPHNPGRAENPGQDSSQGKTLPALPQEPTRPQPGYTPQPKSTKRCPTDT